MDKRLIYPTFNIQGQRDVFNVMEDKRFLTKESSASNYHPEIQAYIKNAKPIPDLIQVLLTALGAAPHWPQNVNGDIFPEVALKHEGPDYGYQTFLTNANYFTHHVNKNPELAKGKVLATVWNDKMKRVELVVGINPTLDPDAATSLDNGESLCFSMGARLPYDVCTVCGNKAKTRGEYCDHLRYQLNQIDPETGMLVGAINPFPKFFDISRVLIPADKTAYMWEKIASASNHPLSKVSSAVLASTPSSQWGSLAKTASVNKTSEIKKQIMAISNPVAVEKLKQALSQVKQALDATSQPIPKEVFNGASSINQCLTSMALLGIVPTSGESKHLVDLFVGTDGEVPPVKTGPGYISITLVKKLAPFAESRSFYRPIVIQRLREHETFSKQASSLASAVPKGAVDLGTGIAKGVFAAIGSIFGITGSLAPKADVAINQMPTGLSALIAQHPVLAGILAAMVMNKLKPATQSQPVVSGNFTVADPTQGLYNNDWQRRFIMMQNRPAAVIKTGAAKQQAESLMGPLTYLLMTSNLIKDAQDHSVWNAVADSYIKHIQSHQYQEIIKSASSISGDEDMSFVVSEIGDFEIIKKALNQK